MFQVNDVVVYGNHGVCKIMDVGPLSMSLADKNTIYYTLCPVYQRKESRIQDGKKITSVDERYFRMAEGQLYEELAYALGIEKEAVVSYIAESVQKKK